jgi:hypothetical protein
MTKCTDQSVSCPRRQGGSYPYRGSRHPTCTLGIDFRSPCSSHRAHSAPLVICGMDGDLPAFPPYLELRVTHIRILEV